MVTFRIYRNDDEQPASDCDMGDLEFAFGDDVISSLGNARLTNMVYISIFDLIDGLLRLKNGAKRYEFVGADSSFVLLFEKSKKGIYVWHKKSKHGPVPLQELLMAVNAGMETFFAKPLNILPRDGAVYADLNTSWSNLRDILS